MLGRKTYGKSHGQKLVLDSLSKTVVGRGVDGQQ